MITPTAAYFIALSRKPDGLFERHCIDYKGSWGFSYTVEGVDPSQDIEPRRIFVHQQTGQVALNDPLFDVMLWNKSEDHAGEVDFESVEKCRGLLTKLGG